MSKKDDENWWQNSNIQSALITGALGLLGTVVTIFATRPAPMPISPSPVGPTELPKYATDPPSPGASIASPNRRLNFAAFQQLATDVHLPSAEREQLVAPLVGAQVVWKGYFDELTIHTDPTDASYFTINLVESRAKLTQSMFKTPALFRMPQSELSAARSLRAGDQITLVGTFESHSLIGTIVTQGHLLKAPSIANSRDTSRNN
ncbi:MAG: hypothetical protein AAGD11_02420 [Planctomycetota bacterium]